MNSIVRITFCDERGKKYVTDTAYGPGAFYKDEKSAINGSREFLMTVVEIERSRRLFPWTKPHKPQSLTLDKVEAL